MIKEKNVMYLFEKDDTRPLTIKFDNNVKVSQHDKEIIVEQGIPLYDKFGTIEIPNNYFYNHCYCCDDEICNDDIVEFSLEFDCFVCERCYERIMNGDFKNDEEEIMYEEWNGRV